MTCSVPVVPVHLLDRAAKAVETVDAMVVPLEAIWRAYLLGGWIVALKATTVPYELDGVTEAEEALEAAWRVVQRLTGRALYGGMICSMMSQTTS